MTEILKVVDEKIAWDESCSLITKYSDGSIKVEPITAEQAARWQAEHGY